MYSSDTDCAHETYRAKLEMRKAPTDHAEKHTMPPLHELSLGDKAEETTHHQIPAQSPLRTISSAGTAADDITTKFRAATSGKLSLPYTRSLYSSLQLSRLDSSSRMPTLHFSSPWVHWRYDTITVLYLIRQADR